MRTAIIYFKDGEKEFEVEDYGHARRLASNQRAMFFTYVAGPANTRHYYRDSTKDQLWRKTSVTDMLRRIKQYRKER